MSCCCLKILENSKSNSCTHAGGVHELLIILLDQIILQVERRKVDRIESSQRLRKEASRQLETMIVKQACTVYTRAYTRVRVHRSRYISAITEHSATRWMYQPLESNSLLWLFSLPFHRSQPLYLPLYFAHYAKICSTIHDTRLNPSPHVTAYRGSFRDDSLATVSFYLNDTHNTYVSVNYSAVTRGFFLCKNSSLSNVAFSNSKFALSVFTISKCSRDFEISNFRIFSRRISSFFFFKKASICTFSKLSIFPFFLISTFASIELQIFSQIF